MRRFTGDLETYRGSSKHSQHSIRYHMMEGISCDRKKRLAIAMRKAKVALIESERLAQRGD